MKRHKGIVPLSHDHHEALVAARRLRRGADAPDPNAAAASFLAFFAASAVPHFREEEELLFPHVVDAVEARDLVVQALLEHQRLHAAAAELRELVAEPAIVPTVSGLMRDTRDAPRDPCALRGETAVPVDRRAAPGASVEQRWRTPTTHESNGPIWGAESEELNATLLSWRPGTGPQEHINGERDVLIVVLAGSATLKHGGRRARARRRRGRRSSRRARRRKISAGRERRPLPVGSSTPAAIADRSHTETRWLIDHYG